MQVCERLIGTPEVISAAAGVAEKSAYHWRRERNRREAGDLPSAKVMRALLEHSDKHQLGLTPAQLIFGAPAAEVEAILAARGSRMEAAE